MDDAGSQSLEQVRTSADNPGNDHLSENAGQNTGYNVTYLASQGGTLIDFQSSNREVWGVWRRREGGGQEEETLVQRAVYDR